MAEGDVLPFRGPQVLVDRHEHEVGLVRGFLDDREIAGDVVLDELDAVTEPGAPQDAVAGAPATQGVDARLAVGDRDLRLEVGRVHRDQRDAPALDLDEARRLGLVEVLAGARWCQARGQGLLAGVDNPVQAALDRVVVGERHQVEAHPPQVGERLDRGRMPPVTHRRRVRGARGLEVGEGDVGAADALDQRVEAVQLDTADGLVQQGLARGGQQQAVVGHDGPPESARTAVPAAYGSRAACRACRARRFAGAAPSASPSGRSEALPRWPTLRASLAPAAAVEPAPCLVRPVPDPRRQRRRSAPSPGFVVRADPGRRRDGVSCRSRWPRCPTRWSSVC
jgi:hypothetical protein